MSVAVSFQEHLLDDDENKSLESFRRNDLPNEDEDIAEVVNDKDGDDFADEVLRNAKRQRREAEFVSNFVSLDFIKPTSNDCESLFSISERAYSKERRKPRCG